MVDFVEICNVCARKTIIEAAKRIINSAKVCRSYSDLNFGVTFFGTQCILMIMCYKRQSCSHFILALKAISAEVMLAVYKLHESQTIIVYQFLWYRVLKRKLNLCHFYVFFRRLLHLCI